MGSHLDFKNFGDPEGNGSKPLGSFSLARQSSIYSLTLDELQNTFGGSGKDFGSMNMDELLKNISTAEECQLPFMTAGSVPGGDISVPGGNLQRQGSLTLPRTLSQKTVDEVWRDLLKETDGVKDVSSAGGGGGGGGGANFPQRQLTLGEMTLEEFLARAGVVREDMQQIGMANNSGFFGNNSGLAIGFQEPNRNNGFLSNNNSVINQLPRLPLNMGGGAKSSQLQQQQQQEQQPKQQQQQQQQQPLFPKQQTVAFAPSMQLLNSPQLASPGARGSMVGIGDPSLNSNLVQSTGLQNDGRGIVGLGSPASQISKSSAFTSSLSPVPYVFGRGRKCGAALEKVVERRQRRMIKNRESAARSRARKQAYTLELEAEVAKLKEMNEELQKKHEEVMEMQKNQMLETVDRPWGAKRQCLRRTLTGPW